MNSTQTETEQIIKIVAISEEGQKYEFSATINKNINITKDTVEKIITEHMKKKWWNFWYKLYNYTVD